MVVVCGCRMQLQFSVVIYLISINYLLQINWTNWFESNVSFRFSGCDKDSMYCLICSYHFVWCEMTLSSRTLHKCFSIAADRRVREIFYYVLYRVVKGLIL